MIAAQRRSQVLLELHLLGPPRVEASGAVHTIARRQVRALLYVLGSELGSVPREELSFLLWPDVPDPKARRNLTHLLTHLRAALPAPDLLTTTGDSVRLSSGAIRSDSAALLTFTRDLPARADADETWWEEGQAIAAAYRGPFLDGFSLRGCAEFELWAVQQQHACERAVLRLLTALAEHHIARGEIEHAIAWSQRHLSVDPLAEEVHRRLISLHTATGQRTKALRQYEQCAAALERELGVHPLPETRRVYEAALDDLPIKAAPGSDRTARPLTSATPEPPLLGRTAALDRLEAAFEACMAGSGGMVMISGEAGIGKSRLLASFAQRVAGEAQLLSTAGQMGGERLPYRPVIELLRTALGRRILSDNRHTEMAGPFGALDEIWLAELTRLLPELRTWYPDLGPPLQSEPTEARTRLIDATCRAIAYLAAAGPPVVICLDDLQWTDMGTRDWLLLLTEHLEHQRCLVVVAYRLEEAGQLAPLHEALARRIPFETLTLDGLDSGAIERLILHVAQAAGRRSMPIAARKQLAARITAVTGGNPFFALEILHVLDESGMLDDAAEPPTELPLPDTIRQAVAARLRRLSPQANQLIESGAVLGGTFDFDIISRIAGRAELETVDGLDELAERRLLNEENGVYAFHHEIVRQVVATSLSPVRRQLLHRRAGCALAQQPQSDPALTAKHYDLGNVPEQALHYYADAVTAAQTLFAWHTVTELQDRMLALLDHVDPARCSSGRLAQRAEILAARAHTFFLQGRFGARDDDLATLTLLANDTGDQRLQLQALTERVRYLNLDAHYQAALDAAGAALELADQLSDEVTRSRLLAQVGFAHYFLGKPRPALKALNAAMATAKSEDDPALRGRVMHILGYIHFHLGNYRRALSCQLEAHACHASIGDLNRVAWDGMDIGAAHLELGAPKEAVAQISEHLRLAQRVGSRPAEAYGVGLLGCVALHQGEYAAALARFSEAKRLQKGLHSEHGAVAAALGMGLALSRLGKLADARQTLAQATHQARIIGHRRRLGEVLLAQGLVESAANHLRAAHALLTEARALAEESECWESVSVATTALARVVRQQGDPVLAAVRASEARACATAHALPGPLAWAESELGMALLTQDDAEKALEHTRRAVAGLPHLHEAWIGHEVLHHAHEQVLRALGEVEAADAQRALAAACLARKAAHIVDPEQRRRYLAFAQA